ncbi:MAG: dTMP kinase [Alphaproteobacteria bacterium]|nr:dTMP kinase [Alphaproteobacteria bacterium]
MRGKFITLEGGEGCGKSTQLKLLADYLQNKGIEIVQTKEPGSTPEGKILRELLVTGDKDKFDAISECLLYYADRRCNLTKVVWPALEQGKWVISDRYADSTEAYQYYGYDKRVPLETLQNLYQIVAGDFKPDLTIILDIEPETGMRRSFAKAATMAVKELRFESRQLEFHHNLRRGFLEIAEREPERCVVLNADADIETIHQKIVEIVEQRLEI